MCKVLDKLRGYQFYTDAPGYLHPEAGLAVGVYIPDQPDLYMYHYEGIQGLYGFGLYDPIKRMKRASITFEQAQELLERFREEQRDAKSTNNKG